MSVFARISAREMAEYTDSGIDIRKIEKSAIKFAEDELAEIKLSVANRLIAMAESLKNELTAEQRERFVSRSTNEFVENELVLSLEDCVADRISDRVAFHVDAWDAAAEKIARATVVDHARRNPIRLGY